MNLAHLKKRMRPSGVYGEDSPLTRVRLLELLRGRVQQVDIAQLRERGAMKASMTRQEQPTDVTLILNRIEGGDAQAAEELLPLVYEELRQLARQRLRQEKPGQTLQATALVHEAYLRLVGKLDPGWNGRGHFFTAAAEAMRRVLIDSARRKATERHGGGAQRVLLDPSLVPEAADPASTLDLAEALEGLEQQDAEAAAVVKLRFFAGLSIPEVARVLGFSPRKVDGLWAYARAWLMQRLREETRSGSPKHPSQ